MHGGNWTQGASLGWLFAHESGHSCFGLVDQYEPPPSGDASPRYCGHTTMANSSKALGYCSESHCYDGSLTGGDPTCTSHSSDWATIFGNPWTDSYEGPFWGNSTPFPTPTWNNPNFVNLPYLDF